MEISKNYMDDLFENKISNKVSISGTSGILGTFCFSLFALFPIHSIYLDSIKRIITFMMDLLR